MIAIARLLLVIVMLYFAMGVSTVRLTMLVAMNMIVPMAIVMTVVVTVVVTEVVTVT